MSEAQVRAVWAQVPDVGCKGLCGESCGPIACSSAEERLLDRRGVALDFNRTTLDCNQLDGFGRCSIYADRPLVCRLWGAVPEMPCVWGCTLTLAAGEGHVLLRRMEALR